MYISSYCGFDYLLPWWLISLLKVCSHNCNDAPNLIYLGMQLFVNLNPYPFFGLFQSQPSTGFQKGKGKRDNISKNKKIVTMKRFSKYTFMCVLFRDYEMRVYWCWWSFGHDLLIMECPRGLAWSLVIHFNTIHLHSYVSCGNTHDLWFMSKLSNPMSSIVKFANLINLMC